MLLNEEHIQVNDWMYAVLIPLNRVVLLNLYMEKIDKYIKESVLIPLNRVVLLNLPKELVNYFAYECLNPLKSGRVVKWCYDKLFLALNGLNPLESGRVVKCYMAKL